MEEIKIIDLIKDNFVSFNSYRAGFLYYLIKYFHSEGEDTDENDENPHDLYQFPIPIEDIGNATLYGTDKAITYMRWIRKALEDKTLVKI